MVIFWSTPARNDLKAIHDYIARDSKRYAIRVTQEILNKTNTLIEFPVLGRTVPEIGEENVREIGLYSYRIVYEVMPNTIYIHGIIHKRRNLKPEDLVS